MQLTAHALYETLISDLTAHLGEAPSKALYPGMNAEAASASLLAKSVFKKLITEVASDADEKAIAKFRAANAACNLWEALWPSWQDELMGSFKHELWRFFSVDYLSATSFGAILDEGDLGPGSNVGARGTDFYTKVFDSGLTCTNEILYTIYQKWCRDRGQRSRFAENRRNKRYGHALVCDGSKLSCVPKSNEISRTICSEPTLNMLFQIGYGRLIQKRLKAWTGIDLADQQGYNRDLAREGSLSERYSTLDLESASDRISLKMLDAFLPRHVVGLLRLFRSPRTAVGRDWEELHMVSSMGNGFTFPLMTAIFCCALSAAYRHVGLTPFSRGVGRNFAVFGDDIVVDSRAESYLRHILANIGHVVNSDKSFSKGPFRESCGGDYFNGSWVRSVYAKDLSTIQARYVLINQLHSWSADSGILLPRAMHILLKSVPFRPVPRWENADSGWRVPSRVAFDVIHKRGSGIGRDAHTQSICYRKWASEPSALRVGFSTITSPRKERERTVNPDGLILSFIKGHIRDHTIYTRSSVVKYRSRRGIAPNWDLRPEEVPLNGPVDVSRRVGLQRWDSVVLLSYDGLM